MDVIDVELTRGLVDNELLDPTVVDVASKVEDP